MVKHKQKDPTFCFVEPFMGLCPSLACTLVRGFNNMSMCMLIQPDRQLLPPEEMHVMRPPPSTQLSNTRIPRSF